MIREYLSSYVPVAKAPTQTIGSQAGYTLDKIIPEDKVDFRTLKDKLLLYILYRRDTISKRAVDVLAALSVARGFKIIPPNPKAASVIKKFLWKFHRTDPINALMVYLRNISEDAGWAGDGMWEREYSKEWTEFDNPMEVEDNEIVGLKKTHPLTMDFKRAVNGEILLDVDGDFGPKNEFLAYTQTLEKYMKKKDIDKRRIMHLRFNTIGDELQGISDLEAIYKTRHRGMSIEDGIAQGAFRHGVPFLDITVGDAEHLPDKEMMDNAREEVKGSSYMSEYVHPPWFKTNMFEQFSLAKSEGMMAPFITLAAAGVGIPESVLLGSGEGVNKATIKELIGLLPDLVIKPRQRVLKLFLEDQLFAPLMAMNKIEEIPYLQWNEFLPIETSFANQLNILTKIVIDNKNLLSWEEAREMMKLPSEEKNTIYSLSRQFLSTGTRGILLVEPHGKLIHEGLKKTVLTKKNFSGMVDIPLILISGSKAFGKIKLGKPKQIDEKEFENTMTSHRVSREEADKWWPDWKNLSHYPIEIIEMFKKTKPVKVPQGIQKFISNVEFLNEDYQEPINVEEGGFLAREEK